MKKKVILLMLAVMLVFTGCGSKEMKLRYGTYENTTIGCKIILEENNQITITGFDFYDLETHTYEDHVIAIQNLNRGENDKLTSEEEQEIRDNIDLAKQFGAANDFEIEQEESQGCIGIYVPVTGCDLFIYIQFFPSNNTLVFDDKIFELTEG